MPGRSERVEDVLRGIEKHIEVERDQTEQLNEIGAAAQYVRQEGKPGRLRVGDQTEYGDVLHELRHFHQDRAAGFPGMYGTMEEGLSDEVDAYAYEVRAGPLLDYADDEMEETVALLEQSIEALGGPEPE